MLNEMLTEILVYVCISILITELARWAYEKKTGVVLGIKEYLICFSLWPLFVAITITQCTVAFIKGFIDGMKR